ncbi:uncharacterized protein [Parasteatoda tepidariorum]|uniref:uncharacterized protein n=1 Tax=Parasteatoda tepidariorum TaxID=114398 RepID=UPI0039BC75A2
MKDIRFKIMPFVTTDKENFTYIWKIENFSSWVQKRGERVKSPWFTADTLDETKWRLDLYPRGIDNGNEICISCYLCRAEMDSGDENVTIGYEFEILGVDGTTLLSKKVESFTFKRKESLGWPDFKSLNEIFRDKSVFLPKDTLTVRCIMWGSFPHNVKATRTSALTEIGVGGCFFKYSIKLSTLETPVHYFVPGPWRIELTFYLSEDENVCVKIRKFGEVTFRYVLQCKVALLDVEGIAHEIRQSEHIIEPKQEVKIWEFPPFIKKNKLLANKNLLLSDDVISFNCDFSISDRSDVVEFEEIIPMPQIKNNASSKSISNIDNLRTDLYRLLSNHKYSDIKLHAECKTFHAHKALLSIRSQVFADIFDRDKSLTSIEIPDLTTETVTLLLTFLYTGTVDDLEFDTAKCLFAAGHKYRVQALIDVCSSFIKSKMCRNTVCDILVLTDEYQDDDLKSTALDYMKEHTNDILLSGEWKRLIENNAKLATEILCKLSIRIGKA